MPRKAAGLTAAKVKTAKPGRYGDGGGLYLLVRSAEARFWLFRYTIGRKMREMGLGAAAGTGAVSLAHARDAAGDLKRQLKAGIDPLDAREATKKAKAAAEQEAARAAVTFDQAAKLYTGAHDKGWRNAKHRSQWEMTLRVYAGPHLGALPVGSIRTEHVTAALTPIWHDKTETASRLRGRIEAVLDYAKVQGWREGENPARWRGHLDKVFPKRSRTNAVVHHAALPWQDIPDFMAALRAQEGLSARALELTILCATRTSETLFARWPEIDLESAVWTVPAERMKAGREHRIPLSGAAVALLKSVLPFRRSDDGYVFPSRKEGKPLSTMALLMLLRRMGRDDLTAHGFRSTFRDWAGETTPHAREVVETALAHRVGDKVEQSYARGDLFTKRRKLMDDWATFGASKVAPVAGLAERRARAGHATSPA